MTTATDKLLANLGQYNLNPSSIQQNSIDLIEEVVSGLDIVDPTNPFMTLLSLSSVQTAAAIASGNSVVRKLYPRIAESREDLYAHMSDKDYNEVFSTAADGSLTFLIPFQQLINNGYLVPNSNNQKIAVIPRNAQITVNSLTLDVGYPIIVNLYPNNIVKVYYDVSISNPLFELSNTIIENELTNFNDSAYLKIKVPVKQIATSSYINTVESTNEFNVTLAYTDRFSYARAYYQINNRWVEMAITYIPLNYDIRKPTLVGSVLDNVVNFRLPIIYQSNNLIGNTIRIDIFTTKGAINIDLAQNTYKSFSFDWLDYDTLNRNPGVTALTKINDIIIYSEDSLIGGTNSITLDELRRRVIYRIDSSRAPVRLSDIDIELGHKGYSIETLVDNVTNKVFIAGKNLPTRNYNGLSSVPLALNAFVTISLTKHIKSGQYLKSIADQNSNRITILPNARYKVVNGTPIFLTDYEINQLLLLKEQNEQSFCDALNSDYYLYSPFHYLIDQNQETITVKPYFLTEPTISNRTAVATNTLKVYNIVTIGANAIYSNGDYLITLTTIIPSNLPTLHVQLTYTEDQSNSVIYLNAESVTIQQNQATIVFRIKSTFDLDPFDNLEITNFKNSSYVNTIIYLKLTTKFNLFYLIAGDNTNFGSSFDHLYFVSPGMGNVIGATYETISINFGQALNNLYSPITDLIEIGSYQTYPNDVQGVYPEDIYLEGPLGYQYTIVDNIPEFIKLHSKGDLMVDDLNNPIYIHKAGDLILDSFGKPIPTEEYVNSIKYSLGTTLFDARYAYANAGLLLDGTMIPGSVADYAYKLPQYLIEYLNNDIGTMTAKLNERCKLWYRPLGRIEPIQVSTGNNNIIQVTSILNIELRFYLTPIGLKNDDVLNKIRQLTRETITKILNQSTITVDSVIETLKPLLPNEVVGFDLVKFLPNDATLVTVMDKTTGFTVGEKIVAAIDGSLDIQDTMIIDFYPAT